MLSDGKTVEFPRETHPSSSCYIRVLFRARKSTLLDRQWGRRRTMVEYQSADIYPWHEQAVVHHRRHVSAHRITPEVRHNSSRRLAVDFESRRVEDPSGCRERDVVSQMPEQRR